MTTTTYKERIDLMKSRFQFVLMGCIILIHLLPFCSHTQNIIPSDDSKIQYTGRIDFADPKAPILFWPGTYMKAKFTGTSIQIILDDSRGENDYAVFIDNNLDRPYILDCRAGKHVYPVSNGLKDTIHQILIFRRTEGFSGPTTFKGFILEEGKTLMPPPNRPERKIEFYGNSITCGMCNESSDEADDEHEDVSKWNNFLAYGAVTARNLNADYTCIAKSGIGILISWFDMIMPEYYDRLNPADPDSKWNFSRWTPDVVVINLFQNDSWLIERLKPVPDTEQIIEAYQNFIQSIRKTYPEAYLVCTLGSMDAVKKDSPWPGYIRKAVNQWKQKWEDDRIDCLFFEFDGTYRHPRVRHHQKIADTLTRLIKTKMNW
jgi:hypothetical protein